MIISHRTVFLAIKAAVNRHREPGRFLLTGSANALLVPRLLSLVAARPMALLNYAELARSTGDGRTRCQDIELLINPNGPLLNGGSDGDNGQTGRKLVMDYAVPVAQRI